MLRFLFSIEEVLGDNIADMIACSIDVNLLRTPSLNATPTCSETLQHFNEALQRFPLSYKALQRFLEALKNLALSSSWQRSVPTQRGQPRFRSNNAYNRPTRIDMKLQYDKVKSSDPFNMRVNHQHFSYLRTSVCRPTRPTDFGEVCPLWWRLYISLKTLQSGSNKTAPWNLPPNFGEKLVKS